jgi:predicted DNA-binding transcriptional regulator AlpA
MSNETLATTEPVETIQPRRILRRKEVERMIGFGRSQIYNMMKESTFPKAKPLGIRRSAGIPPKTRAYSNLHWHVR